MKATNKKQKGDRGELIFYCCLVALPLLQVAIFYFYVNFNSILMAFKSYDRLSDTFYWDFGANFSRFWNEMTKTSILIDAFKNSFIVWLFTSVLGTVLSIVFSYYIFKKWAFGKTFKFFLFLPSVLPSILLVIVFKFFVNEAIPGYVLHFSGKIITPLLVGKDTLMPTILFYNVWVCFGSQILIYTGAMDQISPDILEAGKVDGVSCIREFVSIVVPIILPTVATFVIANVATLFTNQANLYAFFGDNVGYSNYTIGYYLFELVNKAGNGKSMYSYASALGIICTLIAFPLTMLIRRLLNGKEEA